MSNHNDIDSSPVTRKNQKKHLLKLFQILDKNKDGRICIEDLNFLVRAGSHSDGSLTFEEFIDFIVEHDKKLIIAFRTLDRSKSGLITENDLREYFQGLGMDLNDSEIKRLVFRVGKSNEWTIDFNEWREFLLFHPAHNLSDIFKYWRHDIFVDSGLDSAVSVPEDFSEIEKTSGSQFLQLLAGALAGVISRSLTAPIDRVKVLRQVHGYKHKQSSIFDTFRYIIQEGGIHSLWRGNGINVLKMAPETAMKYYCYGHYKRWLTRPPSEQMNLDYPKLYQSISYLENSPLLSKFIAGSMAGSTAQTIIYPLEVLKTRMCLRKTGEYDSLWRFAQSIYNEGGVKAFYRGYLANLAGIIPYAGIELATYDRLRTLYVNNFMSMESDSDNLQHPPFYVSPLIASFAASIGIVITYPAALVRAKLQANTHWGNSKKSFSALELLIKIIVEDGFRGLYRGLGTNMIKVLPAGAISYGTYEAIRKEFGLGPLGS